VSADNELNLDFVDPARREEVRRRIKLLEEYDSGAFEGTAADAARKLGVALREFYDLLRMMRESRRALGAAGALAPSSDESPTVRPTRIEDVDLTFVDPARREEVSRRIGVLLEFERTRGADRQAVRKAIQALGGSRASFYYLLAAWRRHGRAELLPGGVGRYHRGSTLNPEQRDLIQRVEEKLGVSASPTRIAREAKRQADALGIELQSENTLRSYITRAREERLVGTAGGEGIAIDHCAIELAVPGEHGDTAPIGSFVLDLQTRSALGCSLTNGQAGPRTAAAALLDALGRVERSDGEAAHPKLTLKIDRDPLWQPLITALKTAGFDVHVERGARLKAGRTVTATIGRIAGKLKFHSALTGRPASERRPWGDAIPLDEAQALVRARLTSGRSGLSPLSCLSMDARDRLVRQLTEMTKLP